MERVGFIGLGAMGRPMASNMRKKGVELTVYDIDAARTAPLAALGATVATDLADLVRQVDVVFTMLPDSPDVRQVVLGPGGIATLGRPDLLVVDMSTIEPATTDELSAALRERGIAFVDAPVGRTVAFAERGESLFMVGASANDFGRVRPLLETMGTVVHHCGAQGAGIRTKLVNNFLAIVTCQVSAEALALASAFGLDLAKTLEVVTGTTATNGHLTTAFPSKVLKGDIEPGFRIDLAHKDVALALAGARKAGVPAIVGAAALECLGLARGAMGYGGKDFSALVEVVCRQAGLAPPRL